MKLLYNMVFIPLNDDETLIINTLNGLMDTADRQTIEVLKVWKMLETIRPQTDFEHTLYDNLNARGYLVESEEEERAKKQEIITRMKAKHVNTCFHFSKLAFVVTYGCNFRCPYCYEYALDGGGTLSREMVDAACEITGGKNNGVLLFGGEPLLIKNMEIIRYIIDKCSDKRFTVITNGYTLLEYKPLFENISVDYIQVTLDGERETHDRRRRHAGGKPTFDRIIQGVESCLKSGISIRIRMNVDLDNLDQCLAMQEELLAAYKKFGSLFSTEVYPIFQLSNEKKQEIYGELYKRNYSCQTGGFDEAGKIIAPNRPIIDAFLNNAAPRPVFSFCYDHAKTLFADPRGDLYSCILSVGRRELAVGSYYPNHSFKLNSFFTRSVDKIRECMDCKYTFICGGGCPMQLSDYSNVMKPACGRAVHDIHSLIPRIYEIKKANEQQGMEMNNENERHERHESFNPIGS